MDLLALADFVLVARHGGFGKAARAARRPKATLSRRVADLEAALDLRLFERGRRDLKLTEEGRALFERAGALLTELEETAAVIASGSERVRGRLQISAPLLFAQMSMGRLAAEFTRRYPEVRLEVTADDRAVDMIEEGYDLVIRVDPAADEALVGRPFLHDRLVIVAAIDKRLDGGPVAAVVRGGDGAQEWTLTTSETTMKLAVDPVLRLSSLVMIRDAVRAGAGAARLPLSLVSRDIANGRLVHWGDVPGSDVALWALYPSRRLLNARVSAFLDLLRQSFPQAAPEELAAYLDA
ncbi:LysR family transcriptional regulator [Sphingomonas sp. BAUL-RG-20F-R05-02]|uniref:LysR family transcriptional regulator n=1 Tax=Sphingomonas sp. BAUL-RG-20F-R05-02 TaxID=2914830 RepID=UPI001F55B4D8|nr:LysR substrate-binding domain-containing protein [Sphingomonas sp. BAUL-RG-20F-R05-02]